MKPYLFELPGYPVPSYFFFYGLGMLAACIAFEILCRKRGVPGRTAALFVSLICLCVPVGARIYYVVQFWPTFEGNLGTLFSLEKGGQVFYGGLIMGTLAAIAMLRIYKTYRPAMLDGLAVVAPLGLSFGRVGCFMYGCCWGAHWDGPLGVCFPRHLSATGELVGSPAFQADYEAGLIPFSATQSLPVYPVQLIAIGASLLVFGFMLWLYWNCRFEGQLAPLYMMIYAAIRWQLEIVRINPRVAGMTAAQWTGIVIFLVGLAWFLRLRRVGPPVVETVSRQVRRRKRREKLSLA